MSIYFNTCNNEHSESTDISSKAWIVMARYGIMLVDFVAAKEEGNACDGRTAHTRGRGAYTQDGRVYRQGKAQEWRNRRIQTGWQMEGQTRSVKTLRRKTRGETRRKPIKIKAGARLPAHTIWRQCTKLFNCWRERITESMSCLGNDWLSSAKTEPFGNCRNN